MRINRLPSNSLYAQCLLSLATISSNANKDFDASEHVDKLVLDVCKHYVPEDKQKRVEEIIARLAMNMVYGWTDEIPF